MKLLLKKIVKYRNYTHFKEFDSMVTGKEIVLNISLTIRTLKKFQYISRYFGRVKSLITN